MLIVQFLQEKYPDSIKVKDKNGNTALLSAVINGQLPVVQWLLEGYDLCLMSKSAELEVGKLYLREVNGNIAYSVITPKGKMEMDVKTEIKAPSSFDLNNGFDRVSMLGMDSPIPSIKLNVNPRLFIYAQTIEGYFQPGVYKAMILRSIKLQIKVISKIKMGKLRIEIKINKDLISLH